MSSLPRVALGTVQPDADAAAALCALVDVLQRSGSRVQCFRSRACFAAIEGVMAITGRSPRHLDAWLMSEEVCRHVLSRGAAEANWALVEGRFRSAMTHVEPAGGDLETLCDWLDLARVAVIDTSRLGNCLPIERPARLDAIVLDRVRSTEQACRLQTMFESMWNVPVVACLEELPALRCWLRNLPPGVQPPRELCRELGKCLVRHASMERVVRIASRRGPLGEPAPPLARRSESLRVATAYDEAFYCYFPETLELLDACGAEVVDFSPLHDERLPPETDLVYFGCGHPERFAKELAENHCMTMSLHSHICDGGRMYAEGGGLAYLCSAIEGPDGEQTPMVGVFPATARWSANSPAPRAAELPISTANWLAPVGASLRGYVGSRWTLEPARTLKRFTNLPGHELDLVGRNRAIGSRMHICFAAQPPVFDALFAPHLPSVDVASMPGGR